MIFDKEIEEVTAVLITASIIVVTVLLSTCDQPHHVKVQPVALLALG